jgi:hypothetical protein
VSGTGPERSAGTPEYSQGTFEVPVSTRSIPVSTRRYGMSGVNRSACLCAQEFFAVRGMPGTAPGRAVPVEYSGYSHWVL